MRAHSLITVASISALAWIVLIISHEVLGHGGAAFLNGGKLAYFDAMNARLLAPEGGFSLLQKKLNTAAGSLLNLIMMFVAFIIFKRLSNKQTWLGFGLWIFILISAFQAGCYIAFSQFLHVTMDWYKILDGLQPKWLWKSLILIGGLIVIGFGLFVGRRYQYLFITEQNYSRSQKVIVFVVPWLVASVIATLAALFVPINEQTPRWLMVLGGLGNSLNFLIFFPLLALWPANRKRLLKKPLEQNLSLVAIGLALTLMYVFIAGSGIHLA